MRPRRTVRPAAGITAAGALALVAAFLPAAYAAPLPAAAPGLVAPAMNETNTMTVTFPTHDVDHGAATQPVGTTNIVHVPYTFTLTAIGVNPAASGFTAALDLYRGLLIAPANELSGNNATCVKTSSATTTSGATAVTETCTGQVDIYPHDLRTADAGAAWKGVDYAFDAASGGWAQHGGWATVRLTRYAKAVSAVGSTTVTKGKKTTVSGTVTRASWDHHKYYGYAGQSVAVQFRPKNSSTYTTVKKVTTDANGHASTTVTPTASGYWRFSFAGTATTASAKATGHLVTVR